MSDFKFDLTRADGRLERVCEHGVGHTVGHQRGYLLGSYETIHGCDGCCKEYIMQEQKKRLDKRLDL
jgi:hypothetical protein